MNDFIDFIFAKADERTWVTVLVVITVILGIGVLMALVLLIGSLGPPVYMSAAAIAMIAGWIKIIHDYRRTKNGQEPTPADAGNADNR